MGSVVSPLPFTHRGLLSFLRTQRALYRCKDFIGIVLPTFLFFLPNIFVVILQAKLAFDFRVGFPGHNCYTYLGKSPTLSFCFTTYFSFATFFTIEIKKKKKNMAFSSWNPCNLNSVYQTHSSSITIWDIEFPRVNYNKYLLREVWKGSGRREEKVLEPRNPFLFLNHKNWRTLHVLEGKNLYIFELMNT